MNLICMGIVWFIVFGKDIVPYVRWWYISQDLSVFDIPYGHLGKFHGKIDIERFIQYPDVLEREWTEKDPTEVDHESVKEQMAKNVIDYARRYGFERYDMKTKRPFVQYVLKRFGTKIGQELGFPDIINDIFFYRSVMKEEKIHVTRTEDLVIGKEELIKLKEVVETYVANTIEQEVDIDAMIDTWKNTQD